MPAGIIGDGTVGRATTHLFLLRDRQSDAGLLEAVSRLGRPEVDLGASSRSRRVIVPV